MSRFKYGRELKLTALSALLASLAWLDITSFGLFFMFVPLLQLQHEKQGRRVVPWAALAFALWNLATTWSVGYATILAPPAIILVYNTIFVTFFAIYNKVWRKAKRSLAYALFVSGWIACEYLYIRGEISFPWLTLGNGFATSHYFVQWYEYTGVLGGSVWVLIVNILIFEALKLVRKGDGLKSYRQKMLLPLLVIIVPILYSIGRYVSYKEEVNPIAVAVLQPNIDPYNEKFDGLSQEEQENILLSLAKEAPENTQYFIAPETALDGNFWVGSLHGAPAITRLRTFMEGYPQGEFITGAVVCERYPKREGEQKPTATARTHERLSYYYDAYNSALMINTSADVAQYNKSYLVTGVETLPYQETFPWISKLALDMGGSSGSLGRQKDREVFLSERSGHSSGTAICFESINGGFFAGFVQNGAEFMSVITNDGWWYDTPTHRQHLSYARLRAIECRRSIARSANTGISALLNQRGDITESLGWDERGIIVGEINANDNLTFYVKYGDYIGRICSYIFALTLLYFISYIYKKRNHLI